MPVKNLFAAACVVAIPNIASTATLPLEIGGGWSTFRFSEDDKGGAWMDSRALTPDEIANKSADLEVLSFDFTLDRNAVLQITDGYTLGDQFEVFNYGSSLGKTSQSTIGFHLNVNMSDADAVAALQAKLDAVPNIGDDWDNAFLDNRWSSGSLFLSAGAYSISGRVTSQPLLSGIGAVRLVAPVPVPSSIMFMLTAVGGCFAFSRYRNRKAGGIA
ncbi:MAG: hypothetical protein ABJ360_16450 [Roseobacter sp.]